MFDPFLDLFEQQPVLFLGALFVLGAMVGSFLNVVIYRLPVMMEREWRQGFIELLDEQERQSLGEAALEILEGRGEVKDKDFNLSKPRSRCGNCDHQITALENIPLVSYIVLGGKCSACKAPISIQYPLVELFTAIASVVVGWQFGVTLQTAAMLLLTWSLIAASGIDIREKLLPDDITLTLLWFGILLASFDVFVDLQTSIIGAMAGYLSLWSVFTVFKFVTGKEGMGHGDFKLLAALGAWLGWQPLLIVVLLASLVGATIGIAMIAMRKTGRETQIPFGPYLAAAGWITLLWEGSLLRFYNSLFGL